MILDSLLTLSDAQALTASAYSTNTVDLGNVTPKRDIGVGEGLAVIVTVDVAADATTGDETYQFEFVQSANADLSSHDSLEAVAIARGDLVAGYSFTIPLSSGRITKRYVGLRFTLGGTTPLITVTASIQPRSMASLAKPATMAKGYTVS
jgi:Bbp16-like protein